MAAKRAGKKVERRVLYVRLPKGLHKAVKKVAIDREVDMQDMVIEAIKKDIGYKEGGK